MYNIYIEEHIRGGGSYGDDDGDGDECLYSIVLCIQ